MTETNRAANRFANTATTANRAANQVAVAWRRRVVASALTTAVALVAMVMLLTLSAPGLAQAQANRQGQGPDRAHEHSPGYAAPPEMWPVGTGMMVFNGPPEHINRVVDRLLDGLSASDAQRAQIKQIALATATEAKAQRDAEASLRDKALLMFAAPTLDVAGAEALRQQMLVQHDQTSKRTLSAMFEVARVLMPEQRAKVTALMKQRQAVMQERRERLQRENSERAKP